jgi:multipile epidermal growth factor-like domains protein 8
MSFVCSGNLQTTRCHGICPSLRDCQSCLVHGEKVCKWCVQNAKCHQINDREPCGDSEFVEKFTFQWWGSSGVTIDDKTMCLKLDRPPGLTYLKYLYPYDWNMPDSVSIINSTMVEFNTNTAPSIDSSNSGEVLARLNGFLHLPDAYKDQIRVCGSYADINLKITEEKSSIASFLADQNLCHALNMNELTDRTKVLIDLQARRQQKSQPHLQSRVSMQNNATKTFTFEYLEPFSSGNCGANKNCFQCLSDNLCAWCDVTDACMSRDVNETLACSDGFNWRYLTLRSEQCVNCSNFISCQACSSSEACEWWNEDAKCERRGRSLTAIKDSTECASPCHERSNCSSCLNDKGKCVWCQATSQCFSFSVYTSEFQFGLCREWIDQLMGGSDHNGHHQCKSCSAYKNCSSCLKRLSCGWCYLEQNPIEGEMVDFYF